MRKKTSLTIVERATIAVPGFDLVIKKLDQQVTLRGQSKSTLQNYIRRIALFCLNLINCPKISARMKSMNTLLHWPVTQNHLPEAVLNTWYTGSGIIIGCWE